MRTTTFGRVWLIAGAMLGGTAMIAPACPVPPRDPFPLRERGAEVGMALLVKFYKELPRRKRDEKASQWAGRLRAALADFKSKVVEHYSEGTLQRLLNSPHPQTRRAAVVALGLAGTIASNQPVAAMLQDEDAKVRHFAGDALWQLWFRGDKPANNEELQRLMELAGDEQEGHAARALAGLTILLKKAPRFAEAYNQRAILYFQLGHYDRAIADCEAVLKLNPLHFGAASGLARSYMKVKKPRAALKAYRAAYRINPGMEDVGEAIRFLENVLGEEGKK
jgi:tetratricopeptide (TPR) repeat protein